MQFVRLRFEQPPITKFSVEVFIVLVLYAIINQVCKWNECVECCVIHNKIKKYANFQKKIFITKQTRLKLTCTIIVLQEFIFIQIFSYKPSIKKTSYSTYIYKNKNSETCVTSFKCNWQVTILRMYQFDLFMFHSQLGIVFLTLGTWFKLITIWTNF